MKNHTSKGIPWSGRITIQKPAAQCDRIQEKRLLGMHFGASEICISLYAVDRGYVILKIPALFAISKVGEVLAGTRAIVYERSHENVELHSVYQLMKESEWCSNRSRSYHGIPVHTGKIVDAFMRELKLELEKTMLGNSNECVVSVPDCSILGQAAIKCAMNSAGFSVKRVISTSVACALSYAYHEDKEETFIVGTEEAGALMFSLVEYGEMILEVLHTTEIELDYRDIATGKNPELAAYQKALREFLKGGYLTTEEEFREMRKLCCGYKMPAHTFHFLGSNIRAYENLEEMAADGAAIQAAKLTGYPLKPDLLCLDCLPCSMGIEITGPQNQVLRAFMWDFMEQSTIPHKSKPVRYSRKSNNYDGKAEMLRIHIGYEIREDKEEKERILIWPMERIYGLFSVRPEELELMFEVGTDLPSAAVKVTNPGNGEEHKLFLNLYSVSHTSGFRTPNRKEALVQVRDTMRMLKQEMRSLAVSDRDSAVQKGLWQIEKQGEAFLKKRGLSCDDRPEALTVVEEKDLEPAASMIEEMLVIVDSLEYGVRSISNRNISEAEEKILYYYGKFLNILENTLNVTPIEAEGKLFNADIHYAMLQEPCAGLEEGIITGELQRGYYFGGRLLRPAKVKVSKQ